MQMDKLTTQEIDVIEQAIRTYHGFLIGGKENVYGIEEKNIFEEKISICESLLEKIINPS